MSRRQPARATVNKILAGTLSSFAACGPAVTALHGGDRRAALPD